MNDWYDDFIRRLEEQEEKTKNILFEDTETLILEEMKFEILIKELEEKINDGLKRF